MYFIDTFLTNPSLVASHWFLCKRRHFEICSNFLRTKNVSGYWEVVNVQGFIPPGSASHGVAIWKDSMFVIAGESYNNRPSFTYVYDFNGKNYLKHLKKIICMHAVSRRTTLIDFLKSNP